MTTPLRVLLRNMPNFQIQSGSTFDFTTRLISSYHLDSHLSLRLSGPHASIGRQYSSPWSGSFVLVRSKNFLARSRAESLTLFNCLGFCHGHSVNIGRTTIRQIYALRTCSFPLPFPFPRSVFPASHPDPPLLATWDEAILLVSGCHRKILKP